ncbi:MAG: SEC-C metal-binding domain-containing protein [Thermoplasmataceae archaeon]
MKETSMLPEEGNIKKDPESLIERLIHLGMFTDKETIDLLLRMKEETRPLLIDMLYDDDLWDTDGDHAIWAPICIIHILSAMGDSREAAEAVVYAIREYHEEMGDWLTQDASNALSGFGAEAFEPISEMILDRELEEFCRSTAANALFLISGDAGNDFRKRSIAVIKKAIVEESASKDNLARTLLTSDLSDFKDPDSLDFIKSLFQKGLLNSRSLSLEEVMGIYDGQFDDLRHMSRRNPLQVFSKDSRDYYRRMEYSAWTDKKLNGRNDKCQCGSGKKFKKCCMLLGL